MPIFLNQPREKAMKKSLLLNAELSHLIACLGHTDAVTVADAGLPIPAETARID
ncbi:MAG: RbsD/FucU domain-containing protein, partial [Aeromonas sp.]